MTHTLHRTGDIDSLACDYVVQIMPSKKKEGKNVYLYTFNKLEIGKLLGKLVVIFLQFIPDFTLKFEKILKNKENFHPIFRAIRRFHIFNFNLKYLVVIESKNELIEYIKKLKDMDLGMSVVVSGLFSEVFDVLHCIGLRPHTVQFSLGVFGRTELLPQKKILEITTMCGHNMVSFELVKNLVTKIKQNKISTDMAAELIIKQCPCTAINKSRTIKILNQLADDV